jgi:hypothetical protein
MTQPTDPTGTTPPQWSAPPDSPTEPVPAPAPAAPVGGSAPVGGPAPVAAPVAAPAAAPQAFAPLAAPPPVPTTPVAVRAPSRKRGVVDVVLVVAAIFAVGGIGFAAGRVTAPTATAVAGGNRFQGGNGGAGQLGNGGGPAGGFGGAFGGGFGAGGAGITIRGEVVSVTADQLTLKLASGQTVQIPLSSSTTYHTATTASASDVTSGSTVQVQVTRGGGGAGGTGNGGTGNGGTGNGGTGNGGTGGGRFTLGAASDVTVVPQ